MIAYRAGFAGFIENEMRAMWNIGQVKEVEINALLGGVLGCYFPIDTHIIITDTKIMRSEDVKIFAKELSKGKEEAFMELQLVK